MEFTRTIKFKLTLWYSTLLIITSVIFVAFINVLATNYYNNDPDEFRFPVLITRNPDIQNRWKDLTERQQEAVREFRDEDLQKLRRFSMLSLIPLSVISIVGGFYITDRMLHPIKRVNEETKKINAGNLKKQIEYKDVGDEISELIGNFNDMIARLDTSFDSQKQFIENASHELKTPLAIVKANLEASLTDKKATIHDLKDSLKIAVQSTDFMNKLIEDLLIFSVVEQNIEKKQVNIVDILTNSVNHLISLAGSKQISIIFNNRTGYASIPIAANEHLLQRAFMNLIENAIKYSHTQGKILVELSKKDTSVKVRVVDDGIGIEEGEKHKIFDRFYRIDKSRSRRTGGSGLGLSITKRIIEEHHGVISVSSIKGKGSEFTVLLPIK